MLDVEVAEVNDRKTRQEKVYKLPLNYAEAIKATATNIIIQATKDRNESVAEKKTGEHINKVCKSRRQKCVICLLYNRDNRRQLRAPRNTNHSAHSEHCWVYSIML